MKTKTRTRGKIMASCCQASDNSQHEMSDVDDINQCGNNAMETRGNNNYFVKESYSFPKRPEIDLTFKDIRYRTSSWNFRRMRLRE